MRWIWPILVLLVTFAPVRAEEEKKDYETKRTHSVRAQVFEKLEKAQEASEKKDQATALSLLKALLEENLTDYERANVYNFLGMVHYERDDLASAIQAFRNVVDLEDIPPAMRASTLLNLAQLLLAEERYQESIEIVKRLHAVVEKPNPDAHALEAQAYYQLGNHAKAITSLLEALRIAKEQSVQFKEPWLALLRAAYYEREEYDKAAKVLELLVTLYPKKEYWVQLAGLYGLMDRERDQLGAMEAAWEQGFLDREQELVSLAQLFMRLGVPYKAMKVIQKGMKAKVVEEDVDNLRLLAQAMSLAQESQKQIPVLVKAAKLSKDGEIDLYLGQAYLELGEWSKAAASLADAVRKGVKRPGAARLLLGSAYFNYGNLEAARAAFQKAREDKDSAESAEQWLQYVDAEKQRKEALAAAAGEAGT